MTRTIKRRPTMKKRIVTIVGAGAVAVAAISGTSQAGNADVARPVDGVQLEWGTGAPPRYVPVSAKAASASHHVYGSGTLFRLKWGAGGPPELVRFYPE